MESTNVRQIKEHIADQTYRGRSRVYVNDCERVVGVRTKNGQLQVRTLSRDGWQAVSSVTIA